MTIKFVDELPESKGAGKYSGVPAVLRGNPGVWAMIGRDYGSYVTRIKRGEHGFAPAGHFEATGRNRSGGSGMTRPLN